MPVHAQAQRLDSLDELERIEGAHAGTQIPESLHTATNDESDRSEHFTEIHAVIGGRRRIDLGMLTLGPVEFAPIHDHSTDGRAVPAHELGQRMDHDVSAVIDWPT